MSQIEALIDRLKHHVCAKNAAKRFSIAIDGHSAAGKSTISRALVGTWPHAALVQTDDFYRVMSAEARFALSPEEGYGQYYDWQRLLHEVLEPLKQGRLVEFQIYDWDSNELGAWRRIPASQLIIVDGCYSARPEFDALLDFVVLVEADAALRRKRQAERADASRAWLLRWDAAEQHYIEATRLRQRADVIVTGR